MAGLLDFLGSQGSGGGLLDFLRQNAMNQQFGGGLPSDQAQYGQPPMQAMAQAPQAQPAPAQAPAPNAQPAQPAMQPQGFGGFLQGLNENFQNMGNGGSLIGALTGQQPNNQTAQFLVSKGIDPTMAKTIVSDPSLLRSVLPSLLGTGGQTDDIKEYQFAKRENPSLTFDQFMQRKRSVTGEHGLNIVYGTNAKGETVALQPSKSGGLVEAKLPTDVKLSSGTEKVDAGTHWVIYDKRTGAPLRTEPKDIEGKESAEERGKAKGVAQVNLPNVVASAEQTLKIIQDVKNDPNRGRGTGASSVFNAIPASGGFDFQQKVEQLKGKAFLEAFQALKGGGAITEIEGKKAENAIARLNVAQSEGAFLEALNDLETVVTAGIGRAKERAGQPAGGGTAATSPQPSTGLPPGWSVKVR